MTVKPMALAMRRSRRISGAKSRQRVTVSAESGQKASVCWPGSFSSPKFSPKRRVGEVAGAESDGGHADFDARAVPRHVAVVGDVSPVGLFARGHGGEEGNAALAGERLAALGQTVFHEAVAVGAVVANELRDEVERVASPGAPRS